MILSVVDYVLGLTTLSQSNPLKLDRMQSEAMSHSGEQQKTYPLRPCFLLDLPSMEARHKVEQVKAYFSAMHNPKNPLHDAIKEKKGCTLARFKS